MKIALLGQFGSGNSGNDGSLEAMIDILQSRIPDVELHSICANPVPLLIATASKRVGTGAWSCKIHSFVNSANYSGRPRNVLSVFQMMRTLKGVRWLVVPGTGILDDFQDTAFGWPFVVFRWCLIARLLRVKIAFVSIGAGPLHHPFSRRFARSALKGASYRSYRDEFTKNFLGSIGVEVKGDFVFPDIAFNLPRPPMHQIDSTAHKTVGVGVMNYRGWTKTTQTQS
ncbi:hypothetical protein HED50_04785 [Ochrobactrum oryzae]|nr:hypothetical protein [Brucella oryzae]